MISTPVEPNGAETCARRARSRRLLRQILRRAEADPLCHEPSTGAEREPIKSTTSRRRTPMITVAAGILKRNGQILICQRKSTGVFPLQWEFPGGKVEAGEDVQ